MAAADASKAQTKYKYEVVVEDDHSDTKNAVNAASKLISVDGVKAIITTTSGSGNAVKAQAEKAGIIHVCDCADLTIGNAAYNFTNLMLPQDETRAWLDEAVRRGNKTVAILAKVHPGSVALVNALLPQIPASGMHLVFNESFNGSDRDYLSLIAKAKRSGADIYIVIAYPPSLDIVSRELMDAGIKNISTTGLFTTSPDPSLYNGLWFTDSTLTDIAFKERFAAEYPDTRFNARTAPYGYDIFNMLVQSFEKGGDPYANMNSITEFDGKVGKITKDPSSRNFRSAASIWVMQNGQPVMLTR